MISHSNYSVFAPSEKRNNKFPSFTSLLTCTFPIFCDLRLTNHNFFRFAFWNIYHCFAYVSLCAWILSCFNSADHLLFSILKIYCKPRIFPQAVDQLNQPQKDALRRISLGDCFSFLSMWSQAHGSNRSADGLWSDDYCNIPQVARFQKCLINVSDKISKICGWM